MDERVVAFERMVPGQFGDEAMLQRHLCGYAFIAEHCKSVALALDCACGVGYGTHIVATHCGPAIGLDREEAALAYARQHYAAPLAYVCSDAMALPFADGVFDLVTVSQALEHFPDPDGFCAQARRVCRSAAQAVFIVPNRLTQAPGEQLSSDYHETEYDPATLSELLGRHFGEVRLFGIFPGALTARWEETDTWARQSVARDRFGLRRLLPAPLRKTLLGLRRGAPPPAIDATLDGDLLPRYDAAYYRSGDGDLNEAMDLVALCRP